MFVYSVFFFFISLFYQQILEFSVIGSFFSFPILGATSNTVSVYAENRVNVERSIRLLNQLVRKENGLLSRRVAHYCIYLDNCVIWCFIWIVSKKSQGCQYVFMLGKTFEINRCYCLLFRWQPCDLIIWHWKTSKAYLSTTCQNTVLQGIGLCCFYC